MKPISTYTHGILDYLVGALLIFAPEIFQFSDVGGAAVTIPRVIGVIAVLQALLTDYELGVIRVIPMRVHLLVDTVAGLFLAASPFIFGFYTAGWNAWVPHVVAGLAELLVVYNTESRVGLSRATAQPAGGAARFGDKTGRDEGERKIRVNE